MGKTFVLTLPAVTVNPPAIVAVTLPEIVTGALGSDRRITDVVVVIDVAGVPLPLASMKSPTLIFALFMYCVDDDVCTLKYPTPLPASNWTPSGIIATTVPVIASWSVVCPNDMTDMGAAVGAVAGVALAVGKGAVAGMALAPPPEPPPHAARAAAQVENAKTGRRLLNLISPVVGADARCD